LDTSLEINNELAEELNIFDEGKEKAQYYKPYGRTFKESKPWVWILVSIINLGVFITFWFIKAHLPIYNMWIPLHFFIFVAVGVYYFSEKHWSNKDKEKEEANVHEIKRKTSLLD
jgi:hypothetical protein